MQDADTQPKKNTSKLANFFKKVQDKTLEQYQNKIYSFEERIDQMKKLLSQAEKAKNIDQKLKLLKVAQNLGHPLNYKGVLSQIISKATENLINGNYLLLETIFVQQYYLGQEDALESLAYLSPNNVTVLWNAYETSTTLGQKINALQKFTQKIKHPHHDLEGDSFTNLQMKLTQLPSMLVNRRTKYLNIMKFSGYMISLLAGHTIRERLRGLPVLYRRGIFSLIMGFIIIPLMYQISTLKL